MLRTQRRLAKPQRHDKIACSLLKMLDILCRHIGSFLSLLFDYLSFLCRQIDAWVILRPDKLAHGAISLRFARIFHADFMDIFW